MSKVFNLSTPSDYELYHLKFGRGALVIAIEKEDCLKTAKEWEIQEQKLFEDYRNKVRPLKKELNELEKRLMKIRSGVRKFNQPPTAEELNVSDRIESLREEIKVLHYVKREYRSNLQLAMFYAQDVSFHNDSFTRIDKVNNIEETDSHVIIELAFKDRLVRHNAYHDSILSCNPGYKFNDKMRSNLVSGIVKRIIPISSVTLEIISRD